MLKLRFFAERGFSGATVSVALTMFGLMGTMFLLTQFLQFVLGYTPLEAGVACSPPPARSPSSHRCRAISFAGSG